MSDTTEHITVWHVTAESNADSVTEDGLKMTSCVTTQLAQDPTDLSTVEMVTEGVHVCKTRRNVETYARTSLKDVRAEMEHGERFALVRAEVNPDRLTLDSESATSPPNIPDAYVHADPIPADRVEIVDVGVLDEPAGNVDPSHSPW